jgi:hypothetical protein
MAVMGCGIAATADSTAGVDKFWSLGGGYTVDAMRAICISYWKATQKALGVIALNKTVKWKVVRTHETPYNIEGDFANGEAVMVPAFIKAGIRVNIGSHFHVGAFLVRDLFNADAGATCKDREASIGTNSAILWDESKKTYIPQGTTKTIAQSYNLDDPGTQGVFLQLVIGHSGRVLDPLSGRKKCGAATIMWARGKDAALSSPADLSGDKFGFADITFDGPTLVAKFYNTKDADAEMTITITNKGNKSKRRRQKKRAAKNMKKYLKKQRKQKKLNKKKF